jgi:DMSO reductase family type II enzyme chaperone
MPMDVLDQAAVAAARSLIYQTLKWAFSLPEDRMLVRLQSDQFSKAIKSAVSRLPSSYDQAALQSAWSDVRCAMTAFPRLQDYEAEYLRLFEVGIPSAPCPLYESAYGRGDRREVMEELARFYNYFGLSLGQKAKEMPDHLRVELEFLHYLTYLEAQASEEGQPTAGLRRAQRDLYQRHLDAWMPRLWAKLEPSGSPVFSAWAKLTQAFFQDESRRLTREGDA